LQWTLCPFCGNQHIDPYRADLVKTNDVPTEETAVSYESVVETEPTPPEPVPEVESEQELETNMNNVSSPEV
jgi:hypothetical protein